MYGLVLTACQPGIFVLNGASVPSSELKQPIGVEIVLFFLKIIQTQLIIILRKNTGN